MQKQKVVVPEMSNSSPGLRQGKPTPSTEIQSAAEAGKQFLEKKPETRKEKFLREVREGKYTKTSGLITQTWEHQKPCVCILGAAYLSMNGDTQQNRNALRYRHHGADEDSIVRELGLPVGSASTIFRENDSSSRTLPQMADWLEWMYPNWK